MSLAKRRLKRHNKRLAGECGAADHIYPGALGLNSFLLQIGNGKGIDPGRGAPVFWVFKELHIVDAAILDFYLHLHQAIIRIHFWSGIGSIFINALIGRRRIWLGGMYDGFRGRLDNGIGR